MSETVQYATVTQVTTDDTAPTYGNTATGYGRKIPTRYWVRTREGGTRKWRRVYVMNYGNAGSAYIIVRGRELFIRDSDLA